MRDLNSESLWSGSPAARDAHAADDVLRAHVDDVYLLALRMLWHPDDAERATEEILVDVLSRLPSYRDEKAMRSWIFRLAASWLLSAPESALERQRWTFDGLAEDLGRGTDEPLPARAIRSDELTLAEEVKIGCTQTMLLCLDREPRLAYILGDVFEMKSDAAAHILGIDTVTFRRRLMHARDRVRSFMQDSCGLVNVAAACRCNRRLGRNLLTGRVNDQRMLFAVAPAHEPPAPRGATARDPGRVFRDQQVKGAPAALVARLSVFARTDRRPRLVGS